MRRVLLFFLLPLLTCCAGPTGSELQYVTTIHPLKAILNELCAGRAEVLRLVGPGLSPHTYEPRPADVRQASQALALFYVADDIDGWAARVPAATRIELAPLVPEPRRLAWNAHEHGADDGHDHGAASWNTHFWSNPLLVREMLPALTEHLTALDPEGAEVYRANAMRFGDALETLDAALRETLSPVAGRAIAVFHPSWDYFLDRYGIPIAGVVEPFPGKEATPRYLEELSRHLVEADIYAVCTEPQLPRRPAEVVAEACNAAGPERPVRICEIDPNGGVPGRESYAELLRHNAAQLVSALQ
jgi:zinc transport system substrate-binding protein